MSDLTDVPFTFAGLRAAYAAGATAADVIREIYRRIAAVNDPAIFIHLRKEAEAVGAAEAMLRDLPLYGLPFAVKDNIDVAGMPTTAACPAFAYTPARDAFVVARLVASGAIPIGKTNLDQFATGLVGTRSPYGVPRNARDPALVPGGSSSGSAVAVAHGIVPFALGTDTAGSGRVPAALNGIVGLKPSLGALSMGGVVPACRTLDTVSIFANTVADAHEVVCAAAAFDADDPWSRAVAVSPAGPLPPRLTVGIPDGPSARFDDERAAHDFQAAVERLKAEGMTMAAIDFTPFFEVADLLYEGAFLAERYTVAGPLLARDPEALHPVTRAVLTPAAELRADDTFRDLYRLKSLRRRLAPTLAAVDALCVPSVPGLPTLASVEADPLSPNSRLGTYTNFVNLLDLCALATPVPRMGGGQSGPVPASVTFIAPHGRDSLIAALATALDRPAAPCPPVVLGDEMEIAVCGAHMSGMALNGELTGRGGRFLRAVRTTEDYRLFALPGGPPVRPGLVRTLSGSAIALEVWALPVAQVGSLLVAIPSPLGLGTLTLEDGTAPKGFLCEALAVADAIDVTSFGGWREALPHIDSRQTT